MISQRSQLLGKETWEENQNVVKDTRYSVNIKSKVKVELIVP